MSGPQRHPHLPRRGMALAVVVALAGCGKVTSDASLGAGGGGGEVEPLPPKPISPRPGSGGRDPGDAAPDVDPGAGGVAAQGGSAGAGVAGVGGSGASSTGGVAGVGGSAGTGGVEEDAGLPPIEEPECPDAGPPPMPEYECDLFAPQPGGCEFGQSCYPGVVYGADECDPSTFISFCATPGSKTQGQACDSALECADDFVCVGFPFECQRRCNPDKPCPDGLICEGVVGFDNLGTCE